jgi:hypothetical protein
MSFDPANWNLALRGRAVLTCKQLHRMHIPLLFLYLIAWLLPSPDASKPTEPELDEFTALYEAIGLSDAGLLPEALEAGIERAAKHGLETRVLAVADMSQPSTAKRLYVIDLERRVLVMRTFVAHGQNTGELMAEHFSNRHGSHQTSLGLYRVGAEIISPKHGPALLLHGLEAGLNDQALPREVIIHGADYVSESFIDKHGRLGRSWGCPAVSRADMPVVIDLLANGGVLYVHGG